MASHGFAPAAYALLPDDFESLLKEIIRQADEVGANVILTTGGTGFSKRDVTPEATRRAIEREAPGIPEAMRAHSLKITDRAMLSRSVAGIRGESIIINLPGSEKAALENLEAVCGALAHGLDILTGKGEAPHA
jgi:molybdenum cofactor synthesis domain-containing protein